MKRATEGKGLALVFACVAGLALAGCGRDAAPARADAATVAKPARPVDVDRAAPAASVPAATLVTADYAAQAKAQTAAEQREALRANAEQLKPEIPAKKK